MKSITTTLLAIVATTLTLKGVAAAALPEPQTVTFSDGDSIHFAGKRGETPVLARVAAADFVKRHPKDIGIVAKAEDIEDCGAPCDFYIRSEESANILIHPLPVGPSKGPTLPEKRDAELVKNSEDEEDCAAPCDFYIRSEESANILIHPLPVGPSKGPTLPEKRDAELVKNSEDEEDCAAPCDFYIRSVDEEKAADDDLAALWLAKKSDDVADEEDCAAPCDFYIRSVDEEKAADDDLAALWLAKKSDEVADEEECAAPCDFYIR